MEIGIQAFLIVCPLVFLASFIDAIAGGGGLISLPAYLIAGIPAHQAIGTNKLSACVGTVVSTYRYWKNIYMDLALALPCVITAFIGSTAGSSLSLLVSEKVMQYLLLLILPIVAYYVFKKKSFEEELKTLPRKKVYVIAILASLIIGGYDGFYGPGTGTFLVLVYTGMAKLDIKTASGNAKLINLTSNVAALITFIVNGKVLFVLGGVAALFSMAGNYIGSGLVMKNGYKIVRPIILVVLFILFIKIILS